MAYCQADHQAIPMESDGFVCVLEHLLAYPGTYEIPLRTMYTLNCSTQSQSKSQPSSPSLPCNAFASPTAEDPNTLYARTAAAQLRSHIAQHIAQMSSQPVSLPPSFITEFVLRHFPTEVDRIDFSHVLTALDYLKDLEVRRRREVVAALDKLGIKRDDFTQRANLAKKYPGVTRWIEDIEEKEREVESHYTEVYLGIRRWAMIHELSSTPFNKINCIAMLNTLYPPVTVHPSTFVQPTVQLTAAVLSTQRQGFFRYIHGVEKLGTRILAKLTREHAREGEATGWPVVQEQLEAYLDAANGIIDDSFQVSGNGSPTTAEFEFKVDEDARRKVDSGISFGSSNSSNRNSAQSDKSHTTRPSTSSSLSTHSRKTSKEKAPDDDDVTLTGKVTGSTFERIARELRRMKSSKSVKDAPNSRKGSATLEPADIPVPETPTEASFPQPIVGRPRGLSFKRSLRNMRSKTNLKGDDSSRPSSRNEDHTQGDIPAFDAEEMRRRRMIWEARRAKGTNQL